MANIFYFWRFGRGQFGVIKNVLVPVLGLLLNAYLIYAAFFSSLWSGGWRTGKSVVLACVLLLVAQFVTVLVMQRFRSRLFTQGAPMSVSAEDVTSTERSIL